MLRLAPSWCDKSDLDDLRCVIRLAVETFYYLQRADVNDPQYGIDLRHQCESTFSGIESFSSVARIYKVIGDRSTGLLSPQVPSLTKLKEQFSSLYDEFCHEATFEERCLLLLDLFRLQLVFAAMNYAEGLSIVEKP